MKSEDPHNKDLNQSDKKMNKKFQESFLSRENGFLSSSSSFPSGKFVSGGLGEILTKLSGVSLEQNFSEVYGGHWMDPIELDEEKFLLKKHSKIMTLIHSQKVYSPKAFIETFADELRFSSKTLYKVQRILVKRKMLNITHWEGLAKRTFGMTLYFTNNATLEDFEDYMREYYNQDTLRYKKQLQREKKQTFEQIKEGTKMRAKAIRQGFEEDKREAIGERKIIFLCDHGYMPKLCTVSVECKNSKW